MMLIGFVFDGIGPIRLKHVFNMHKVTISKQLFQGSIVNFATEDVIDDGDLLMVSSQEYTKTPFAPTIGAQEPRKSVFFGVVSSYSRGVYVAKSLDTFLPDHFYPPATTSTATALINSLVNKFRNTNMGFNLDPLLIENPGTSLTWDNDDWSMVTNQYVLRRLFETDGMILDFFNVSADGLHLRYGLFRPIFNSNEHTILLSDRKVYPRITGYYGYDTNPEYNVVQITTNDEGTTTESIYTFDATGTPVLVPSVTAVGELNHVKTYRRYKKTINGTDNLGNPVEYLDQDMPIITDLAKEIHGSISKEELSLNLSVDRFSAHKFIDVGSTRLVIDPINKKHVYATISGFEYDTESAIAIVTLGRPNTTLSDIVYGKW